MTTSRCSSLLFCFVFVCGHTYVYFCVLFCVIEGVVTVLCDTFVHCVKFRFVCLSSILFVCFYHHTCGGFLVCRVFLSYFRVRCHVEVGGNEVQILCYCTWVFFWLFLSTFEHKYLNFLLVSFSKQVCYFSLNVFVFLAELRTLYQHKMSLFDILRLNNQLIFWCV